MSLRSTSNVPQKIRYPAFGPVGGLLCSVLHPIFKALCPRQSTGSNEVSTPLGSACGVSDTAGATRFAVKYATASRWGESALVTSWALP